MTKKDKNKYGLHPSEFGINKTTDGKDKLGNKYYQKGVCVFPYKKKGEDKKYYECFDDKSIGKKVCPTSLDKKTKEIVTVGICEDIDKLRCEILPKYQGKKSKGSPRDNDGSQKKEKKTKKKKTKKYCDGMYEWCTGGYPNLVNPPQEPPDMDDPYEFLRQKSGMAAINTNPNGNCLFHSLVGSIILDPELGEDFLKLKIQMIEDFYLSPSKRLEGDSYGDIFRNGYLTIINRADPQESINQIYRLNK